MDEVKLKGKNDNIIKPVSPWERILWFCAASDANILSTCPVQIRRFHRMIGIFVLITTCFAFISALIAARFFHVSETNSNLSFLGFFNKNLWVVLPAFIWSLMIFNIDRMLISTIYKAKHLFSDNTSLTKRAGSIIFAFIIRLLIAYGIASSISKVVEMQIFEKAIISHSLEMKDNAREKAIDDSGYIASAEETSLEIVNDEENLKLFSEYLVVKSNSSTSYKKYSNLNNHPSLKSSYDNAVTCSNRISNEIENQNNEISTLRQEINIHNQITVSPYITHPLNQEFWVNSTLQRENLNQVIARKNVKIQELEGEVREIRRECSEIWGSYRRDFDFLLDRLLSDKQNLSNKIKNNRVLIDSLVTKNDEVIAKTNEITKGKTESFYGMYNVLKELEKQPSVKFLSLFLFAVFFIIELLPIMGKYMIPTNSYDFKIAFVEWKQEQEVNFLRNKYESEINLKNSKIAQFIEDIKLWDKIS